jgi:alpha-D-xyloside xylohydrolase
MNTPPSNNVYIRWTQFGVFTSHLRYHGTSPREPWFFPDIAPLIRKWLNLRYALIPYLMQQSEKTSKTGFPVLRAMLLHFPEDPVCWNIDDQFFCGDNFLVCPVMNDNGTRDVYLPAGYWIDFWTGRKHEGGKWLMNIESSLEILPVFCPEGSEIPLYPEVVQCTDQIDLSKIIKLRMDKNFTGYKL